MIAQMLQLQACLSHLGLPLLPLPSILASSHLGQAVRPPLGNFALNEFSRSCRGLRAWRSAPARSNQWQPKVVIKLSWLVSFHLPCSEAVKAECVAQCRLQAGAAGVSPCPLPEQVPSFHCSCFATIAACDLSQGCSCKPPVACRRLARPPLSHHFYRHTCPG